MNPKNSIKTSVSDGRDNLRKQIGLNLEKMKTCEGAGALTKEQGGTFCSETFLYTTGKIVSIVEISKERERPRLGSEANENFLAEMNGHDIAESVGSFNNANDNKPVPTQNIIS
jgi:hypothetical protein